MRISNVNRNPGHKVSADEMVMGLILAGIGLVAVGGYSVLFFGGFF